MGGPGSGRRSRKTSIADCRALDVGELCDGGAARAKPRGDLVWKDSRSGAIRAALAYVFIEGEPDVGFADGALAYLYWPTPQASARGEAIKLTRSAGRPWGTNTRSRRSGP
jgi:hypothetical protein